MSGQRVAQMRTLRCAIYTRKSTEEGLDQAFNTLHAQREACEAYIRSQVGEGWERIATAYDDGGFSGGTLERPALKQLLGHVAAGEIDVVVVYKVDRLTRSLMDFAKIVEVFDRHRVSFVSVTQSFNTTTSMGRLTLNVLLSFAQFEREVTGERIRDKIAASKAKGIWMGGMLPLGYDARDRRLVINPAEAEQVRALFSRYLALRSLPLLRCELITAGIRSKRWTSRRGREMGGAVMSCGALSHLLQNRLYLGETSHKGEVYDGEHEAIVDPATFRAVQAQLDANRRRRRARPTRAAKSPLVGLLFDAEGVAMSPTFGYGQGGRLYRYYASATVLPGRTSVTGPLPKSEAIRRVSAPPLEALVLEALRRVSGQSDLAWPGAAQLLVRVQLRASAIELVASCPPNGVAGDDLASGEPEIRVSALDGQRVRAEIQVRPVFRGGRTALATPGGGRAARRPNAALIRGLRSAHQQLRALNLSPLTPTEQWVDAIAPSDYYGRRLAPLAFLAPELQRAILQGRQPPSLTLNTLLENGVPLVWAEQRERFGFAPD